MPNFNKGVFEDIHFEAIPIGKFRILSSIFRWYRPYAPGSRVDFKLKVKPVGKDNSSIKIVLRVGEKEELVGNYLCDKKGNEIKIAGISVSGEGRVDYCLKPVFDDTNKKYVVVVSVTPFHNDQWVVFAFGSIVTFLCVILAWLLNGLIHLRTFWEMWIPLNPK